MASYVKRVAISSAGMTLDDEVDPHFGRCECFLVVEGDEVTVIENSAHTAREGAGIRSAQLMIDQGITDVITGSVGPKAFQVLRDAGIRIYTGCSGKIMDSLKKCQDGELEESAGASHRGHKGA